MSLYKQKSVIIISTKILRKTVQSFKNIDLIKFEYKKPN